MSAYSRLNLGLLVFEERRKPENLEPKNFPQQRREPMKKSTNIWRRRQDLNSRHIGGISECSHHCATLVPQINAPVFVLPSAISPCLFPGGGGGYSTNVFTGRLRPGVQSFTLIRYHFSRKRYPFQVEPPPKGHHRE